MFILIWPVLWPKNKGKLFSIYKQREEKWPDVQCWYAHSKNVKERQRSDWSANGLFESERVTRV